MGGKGEKGGKRCGNEKRVEWKEDRVTGEPENRNNRSIHYGSEQPEIGTSKFTLSHELGSE